MSGCPTGQLLYPHFTSSSSSTSIAVTKLRVNNVKSPNKRIEIIFIISNSELKWTEKKLISLSVNANTITWQQNLTFIKFDMYKNGLINRNLEQAYEMNLVSMLGKLVIISHLVVSIQLSHCLFLVCHDPYELCSVLTHLPFPACKHIT